MKYLLPRILLAALPLLNLGAAQDADENDVFPDLQPRAGGQFKTSTANPPKLTTKKSGQSLAPGYILFQPMKPIRGGFMMTEDGDLVLNTHAGTNLDVGTLHGKPIIMYHYAQQGGPGFAYGPTVIMDNTYKVIHTVCPKLGLFVPFGKKGQKPNCEGDLHESQLDDGGTLAVTAYNVTKHDLSSIGGPKNGWVIDGQFHVIDVKTSKTLFSWKSLDHVPLQDSHHRPKGKAGKTAKDAFDYFHINAVEQLPDGRFLVSSRQTWNVYIVGKNGEIQASFDGQTGGSFGTPPDQGKFSYQHDPRLKSLSGNELTITIFGNNNGNPPNLKRSAGLQYHLDLDKKKATLQRALIDPKDQVTSRAEGSVQILENGNTFVSYGTQPIFKEFGPNGNHDVRLTITYGMKNQNQYRVYKKKWHATPNYPPSVAAQGGKGFVSWNGATNITSYAIFTGKNKNSLKQKATVNKKGFETSFTIPNGAKFMKVAALRGSNQIRSSKVISV